MAHDCANDLIQLFQGCPRSRRVPDNEAKTMADEPESTGNRDDLDLALAAAAFWRQLAAAFPEGLPEDTDVLRAFIDVHRDQWLRQ